MKERITIGRSPESDIRIDSQYDTVSSNHAEIVQIDGKFKYTDHSTNGTTINGQKLRNESKTIYPGDEIKLAGKYTLDWKEIRSFYPQISHPTVPIEGTRKLDQGQSGGGRKTEAFDSNKVYKSHYVEEERRERHEDHSNHYEKSYSHAQMDKELEGWNWGAFFCSWLWGIFNGIYWPVFILLIMWVPYMGQVASLCLCVYLGLNGSKMAWQTGKYDDYEHFKNLQRKWAIGGAIWFAFTIYGNLMMMNAALAVI